METLYQKLASELEKQIKSGIIKPGEKLPSVRFLHKESGLSISTVLQSMYLLESKGLISAKAKRGYFVNFIIDKKHHQEVVSKPDKKEGSIDIEDFIQKVYAVHDHGSGVVNFSIGIPSPEMLPIRKLKKVIHEIARNDNQGSMFYESIAGNESLRRQIAHRTLLWEHNLEPDDIITTNGCMNSLAQALISLTRKGDTVLVESPVYFGTLQLAKSMELNVIELPTSNQVGIDLDVVKKYFKEKKVSACIIVSNFSNPMGYCMPEENKKLLVKLCSEYQVPLIEEDLYGDVYFGEKRPLTCKSIDTEGIVLWCSSISKTLAPGYRVGWIAPGKFKNQVLKTKLYHNIASPALTHQIVAQFIEKGRYENHLQKLRIQLHHNLLKYLQVIHEYFPDGTKTTNPDGGFLLWVELDKSINTSDLYDEAFMGGIKYAPGRMFTLRDQFYNCLRLSYGLTWNDLTEKALIKLGRILQTKSKHAYNSA